MGSTCSFGIVVSDDSTSTKSTSFNQRQGNVDYNDCLPAVPLRRDNQHRSNPGSPAASGDRTPHSSQPLHEMIASGSRSVHSNGVVETEVLPPAQPRAALPTSAKTDGGDEDDISGGLEGSYNCNPLSYLTQSHDTSLRSVGGVDVRPLTPTVFPLSPRGLSLMQGGGGGGRNDTHPLEEGEEGDRPRPLSSVFSSGTSFFGSTSCTSHLSIHSRCASPSQSGASSSVTDGRQLRVSFRTYALVMGNEQVLLTEGDESPKISVHTPQACHPQQSAIVFPKSRGLNPLDPPLSPQLGSGASEGEAAPMPLTGPMFPPITPQINIPSMCGLAFSRSSSCQSDLETLCEDVGVAASPATILVPLSPLSPQRQQIALRRKRSGAAVTTTNNTNHNGGSSSSGSNGNFSVVRRRARRGNSPGGSTPLAEHQWHHSFEEIGLDIHI
ncbi:Hypothetical protein, putative [Bodo saltans]|uniref:Uncharacterized protein n=1 Tax=Bodo saltans TaxID=75058 RepID=A0A0S4J4T9_BODSA|nr:Hypothetical protein, putative [Bodo saltans]|eukprot:CUG86428.1 Hypothetical protein, putative [Bodo saltans]